MNIFLEILDSFSQICPIKCSKNYILTMYWGNCFTKVPLQPRPLNASAYKELHWYTILHIGAGAFESHPCVIYRYGLLQPSCWLGGYKKNVIFRQGYIMYLCHIMYFQVRWQEVRGEEGRDENAAKDPNAKLE